MTFVGFYDVRPGNNATIYVGGFISNTNIIPCPEISWGNGQCGQCASEARTLIAYDTKKLTNYIPCDDDTRSEIVVPCFGADGKVKTVLDIDGPEVGLFTEDDTKALEIMVKALYPSSN